MLLCDFHMRVPAGTKKPILVFLDVRQMESAFPTRACWTSSREKGQCLRYHCVVYSDSLGLAIYSSIKTICLANGRSSLQPAFLQESSPSSRFSGTACRSCGS